MNRNLRSFALLTALSMAGAPALAQDFAGTYEMVGNADVTMLIVPLVHTGQFLALVFVEGELDPSENAVYFPPRGNDYTWMNARGNGGVTRQNRDGTLDDEVTSGPNEGTRTSWRPLGRR